MTYAIIRVSDNVKVASNLTQEEAGKQIIFYDCEETPHIIQSESENENVFFE